MKRMLAVIAMLGLICGFAGAASADLTDGLVGYWPFDGHAMDESGNGNDGRVHGASLTEDRFGEPDMAYSFDGIDDYVQIQDSEVGNVRASGTISLWALVDSEMNFDGRYHNLLEKDDKSYWMFAINEDRDLRFRLHEGYYGQGCWDSTKILDQADVADIWVFLAVVKAYNVWKIYLNGTLFATRDTSGCIDQIVTTAPLTIGRSYYWTSQYFRGAIDDVRIYDRALTEAEIQELYQPTHPIWEEDTAEASSAYGPVSAGNSSILNNLSLLLLPIGTIVSLRILRRKP